MLAFILLLSLVSCVWSQSSIIYEVNFRVAKTFDAFQCRKLHLEYDVPCSYWAETVSCSGGSGNDQICRFILVDEPVLVSRDSKVLGRLDASSLVSYNAYRVVRRDAGNVTNSAFLTVPPSFECNFPHPFTAIFSDSCLTPADVCLDPTCSTYAFFAFEAIHSIPTTHFCVGSYYGYGSVYGTMCEKYAQYVSPYYYSSLPQLTGFTDVGEAATRVTATLDCVYEYTKKPLGYISMFKYLDVNFDYLSSCSTIYFLGVDYALTYNVTTGDLFEGGPPRITSYRGGELDELKALRARFIDKKIVIVLGGPNSRACNLGWLISRIGAAVMTDVNTAEVQFIQVFADFVNQFADVDFGIDFFNAYRQCDVLALHVYYFRYVLPLFKNAMPSSKFHLFLPSLPTQFDGIDQFELFEPMVDYFPLWGDGYHNGNNAWPLNIYDTIYYKFNGFEQIIFGIKEGLSRWIKLTSPGKIIFIWHTLGKGRLVTVIIDAQNLAQISYTSNYPPFYAAGGKHPQLSHDGVDYLTGHVPMKILGDQEVPYNYYGTHSVIVNSAINTYNETSNIIYYSLQERMSDLITGLVWFSNSSTFKELLPHFDLFAIKNFALGDVQFSPFAPARYRTLFASRKRRQTSNMFYFVPSTVVNETVECPGIIFISDKYLASVNLYKGAYKASEVSTIFWYFRSVFDCSQVNNTLEFQIFPSGTRESCNMTYAVNLNTHLPAELNDVNILCGNGIISVVSVDLCADIQDPPVFEPIMLDVPVADDLTTWPEKFIEIYTDWSYHYDYITLEPVCTVFNALPSCQEMICGRDANCYDALNRYEVASICDGLQGSILLYNEIIAELKFIGVDISSLNDQFLSLVNDEFGEVTTGTDTGITRRKRFAVGSVALGVAIAATVLAVGALSLATANRIQLDEVRNDLAAFKTSTRNKVNEIETKHNEFKALTQTAFIQQAEINAIFNANQQQIAFQQRELSVLMDSRYKTHSQILQAHAASIAALATDVLRITKLFVNVHIAEGIVYTAVATGLRLKDTYNKRISNTRRCMDSLSNGDLAGCVKYPKNSRLLSVRVFNSSSSGNYVKAVAIFYASRQRVGGLSYRAATSFCDYNKTSNVSLLYIAAGGCEFVLNGTEISHTVNYNTLCPEAPSITQVQECPSASVKLETQVRDSVTLNFSVARPVVSEIPPSASGITAADVVNITTGLLEKQNQSAVDILQPVETVNLTVFNNTIDRISKLEQLNLAQFDNPSTLDNIGGSYGFFGIFTFDRIFMFGVTFIFTIWLIVISSEINLSFKTPDTSGMVSIKHKYS